MYKTVKQGDSCLQYRILPQEEGGTRPRRRWRRRRVACLLTAGLVIACLTVAGAVLLPILLSTNIVALPAGFHTFALRQHASKYAQYIAIVPVREAHFKILPAWGNTPPPSLHLNTSTSSFVSAQWADLTVWKVSPLTAIPNN
jgi:hypothetical protein